MDEKDYLLSSYHYDLPECRIAQYPPEVRGTSRLMVLDRHTGATVDAMFADLPDFLPKDALLVANNTKVVPARLQGCKPSGGKAEMLLLTPPPLLERDAGITESGWHCAKAEALLKPTRSIHEGMELTFGDFIRIVVLQQKDFGRHDVLLFWKGVLAERLTERGSIPIPPYIKRRQEESDKHRYQTCYARDDKAGSVAAPTAGLHFTDDMRAKLASCGISWAEVTLHVGYGTFSPVREEHITEHAMHGEYAEINAETARAVMQAKAQGRPVIAVGTTACRTLEGCSQLHGGVIPECGWQGWTNIFIYPGYKFNIVDKLITNFHLPESSLLMLVSALCGRERILSAYRDAVRKEYRFFSYGDAMFIR